MGSLYTRSDRNAAGVLVPSSVIWLKFRDASGKIVRQSSGTESPVEAKRLLNLREGAAAEGKVILESDAHEALAALREPSMSETFRLTAADLDGFPAMVQEFNRLTRPDFPQRVIPAYWNDPRVIAALARLEAGIIHPTPSPAMAAGSNT